MILTSAFYYQIRVTNVRLQVERECPNIKQTVKLWPQHFVSLGTNQRPPRLASVVVFKGSLNPIPTDLFWASYNRRGGDSAPTQISPLIIEGLT